MARQPEELVHITTRRAVLLERLKSGTVQEFRKFLREMDKSLRERLSKENLTTIAAGRLRALLKDVAEISNDVLGRYNDDLTKSLQNAAPVEARFQAQALEAVVVSSNYETVLPAANQLWAAITTRPLGVRDARGAKLLDAFIRDWKDSEVEAITNQVRQAAFEGMDTQTLIRQIRGNQSSGFRDGTLAQIDRHNGAIVRTALQHVSVVARQETLAQNDIEFVRIIATLDSKTTQICRSMDHRILELAKGPLPPYHVNCRTTFVPELPDSLKWLSEGAERASMNGPVSADLSYYDWLKTQTAAFQDTALGPIRGKLFRDGGLSPKEFAELNLSKTFEPLTLAQMEEIAPQVFERAGVRP